MSSQLRWRSLTYCHRGCRATSKRAFKFLVAKVTYKMTPRLFTPKCWNRFFAIYVVRLALYVCLKNICDGVGGQDESNGTPLDPPLFWLDNIFKEKVHFHQIESKYRTLLWLASIMYNFCTVCNSFLLLILSVRNPVPTFHKIYEYATKSFEKWLCQLQIVVQKAKMFWRLIAKWGYTLTFINRARSL